MVYLPDNRIAQEDFEELKKQIAAIAVLLAQKCDIDRWMAIEVVARTAKHMCRRDI